MISVASVRTHYVITNDAKHRSFTDAVCVYQPLASGHQATPCRAVHTRGRERASLEIKDVSARPLPVGREGLFINAFHRHCIAMFMFCAMYTR